HEEFVCLGLNTKNQVMFRKTIFTGSLNASIVHPRECFKALIKGSCANIDEGKSGKSIDGRPEMTRLLKNVAQKKFDTIIIYKLDRLARKTRDSLEIAETLNNHGVQLISLSESIDTSTPHGRMFYTVLSSLAEMEREQIVGRVKMGMTQRAKEGKWNGGQCLGYNSKDKKLFVNHSEAR